MTTTSDNPLVSFVLRRWKYLCLATLAAAAGAVALAPRWSSTTYACNTVLFYNRTMLGAPHYQQPEVQAIAALVRSRPVVEAAAAEFGGPGAAKPIADSVTVEIPPGSQSIQLTMRGSDPQRTRLQLERLAECVVERAAAIRRRTVDGVVAAQQERLVEARSALTKAERDLTEFHVAHGVRTTVADDLERLRNDVATVELSRGTERPTATDPEEALRRRRSAIQERLVAERDAEARATELELKREEFRRAERLHAKRYISDAEFQRVTLQLRSLERQHEQEQTGRRTRLAEIDQALRATENAALQPAADARDAEADERREAFLADRLATIERLSRLRSESLRLEQAVQSAQAEVTRIAALTTAYDELRGPNFRELTIVQPAAPTLEPATSTKKKVLAGLFAGLLALLLLPMSAWDVCAAAFARRRTGAAHDLPVLAAVVPFDGRPAETPENVVRTASLRIQQSAREGATVVLVQPLADSVCDAAADLAECLTKRGEKVVVVETSADHGDLAATRFIAASEDDSPATVLADWVGPRGRVPAESQPEAPRGGAAVALAETGLSEWLADPELPVEEVVRRGRMFDWVAVGATPLPIEAYADPRLSQLLEHLRRSHSVVLVVGPRAEASIDVEMLAARADSVLFVSAPGRTPSPGASRTLAALRERRAPVLGLIVLGS